MDASSTAGDPITAEWCAEHFDHLAPQVGRELHETLEHMRTHPVAHSDQHGGFWVATSYDEVLRVAQDWEHLQLGPRHHRAAGLDRRVPAIPEMIDPPLHREFKRLINAWFTPAVVAASRSRPPATW